MPDAKPGTKPAAPAQIRRLARLYGFKVSRDDTGHPTWLVTFLDNRIPTHVSRQHSIETWVLRAQQWHSGNMDFWEVAP